MIGAPGRAGEERLDVDALLALTALTALTALIALIA
jgi:hypothetical protein